MKTDIKWTFLLDIYKWLRKAVFSSIQALPLLKALIWLIKTIKLTIFVWHVQFTRKGSVEQEVTSNYLKGAHLRKDKLMNTTLLHTSNFVGKAVCFTTERLTRHKVPIRLKELIYAKTDCNGWHASSWTLIRDLSWFVYVSRKYLVTWSSISNVLSYKFR